MDWKFDKTISEIFPQHVRQHIPNYDQVIDQSVAVSELHGKNCKIIDVGCAVGETLKRLQQRGFTDLTGVDNSQYMLDYCPKNINLICSDQFPKTDLPFDVILCNWTLHFMQDKQFYLESMADSLKVGGHLVLSEKTSLDSLPIGFYHDFKSQQGVSYEEIKQKESSLVNVMHINDYNWYLEKLAEVGFRKIWIINAYWCFTTFLAEK
jgi:tRNA (cmo5U34)-methyltransferase